MDTYLIREMKTRVYAVKAQSETDALRQLDAAEEAGTLSSLLSQEYSETDVDVER